MSSNSSSFLPYHEPEIVTILIQSSFLLALNLLNTIFDKLLFCGLLGQVFIGVTWGTPGAKWLDFDMEDTVVQLGYLGLILLVYEGGLNTNFTSLKANIFLSSAVALTGIGCPIALSFILLPLVGATPLQAFAAGAALCSTSLGTTFTILSTSGLSSTRLGTVLTTAAMMDDVIGLVMVQVISNLGESSDAFNAVTLVRPLAVSVGFAVITPLVCRLLVSPLTKLLNRRRKSNPDGMVQSICTGSHTPFVLHTLTLLVSVTSSTYAGTSNLFAAYLAGASISWWDSEVPHLSVPMGEEKPSPESLSPSSPSCRFEESTTQSVTSQRTPSNSRHQSTKPSDPQRTPPHLRHQGNVSIAERCGSAVFHRYYAQTLERILKPFFFASIGLAIPITEMFSGEVVWRGIVYTILMLFGKLITGLWLARLGICWPTLRIPTFSYAMQTVTRWKSSVKTNKKDRGVAEAHQMTLCANPTAINGDSEAGNGVEDIDMCIPSNASRVPANISISTPAPGKIKKPLSIYPAVMFGTAMTARGEIGFLIASLAETTGLFASLDDDVHSTDSSKIYLIVTWAIVLCTIIGPLSVGTLVKRVRKLQAERENNAWNADPLGIWGVN